MTSSDPTIKQVVASGYPRLTQVRIYQQSWDQKVAIDHSDVPYDAVLRTIKDPCMVCESKTTPGSLVLVNTQDTNPHGHVLRVPIKPYGNGTATFKSAYYSSATSHGTVIWNRGDA